MRIQLGAVGISADIEIPLPSPPPPGGCYLYVAAGNVDVKVKVWGPGAGVFGADYHLHNEFKISPGSFHHENSHPRNIQLIVNGKWYEIKDVLRTYKSVSIDNEGFVGNGGRQWGLPKVSCLSSCSGCSCHRRGPFSSRSTTRSKGEKRREKNIILKCGPWRKTIEEEEEEKKKKRDVTPLEREEL